jgi:tetratricopeptide (TPR) repeat protein
VRAGSILFAVVIALSAWSADLAADAAPSIVPASFSDAPAAPASYTHRIVTHAPGGPLLESPILSRLDYYKAVHAVAGGRWSEAEAFLVRASEGDPSLVRAHLLLALARLRQLEANWILSVWDAARALLGNFRAQSLLAANAVVFALLAAFFLGFAASSAAVLRALPSIRHAIEEALPGASPLRGGSLGAWFILGSAGLLFRPWGWGPGIVWLTVAGILLAWRGFARAEKAVAAAFLLSLVLAPAALRLAVHVALPSTPGTTLFALSGMPVAPLGEERLASVSSDADVLFSLALLERERGNRQRSIDLYREILDGGSEAAAVYNNLGNLLFVK